MRKEKGSIESFFIGFKFTWASLNFTSSEYFASGRGFFVVYFVGRLGVSPR